MFVGNKTYQHVETTPEFSEKDDLNIFSMSDHDLVYVPMHTIHGFINDTNRNLLLYFIWSPDKDHTSILNYFREVGIASNEAWDNPHIPPTSHIKFVSEASRFGINQSHNFWQYVQSITFSRPSLDDQFPKLRNMIAFSDDISIRGTNHE